jgi:hypothetical protein
MQDGLSPREYQFVDLVWALLCLLNLPNFWWKNAMVGVALV